jgi:uroporphyrinogen-III decarboxylase
MVNFGDNVHAGVLSPRLFEKYTLPAYQRLGSRLRSAGKFTTAHWDGDVKPLLPFMRATGLSGIEAVTPRPQGDVDLPEVRKAMGEEMYLFDGIAALLFDPLYPLEDLLAQARQCIELFAPRLVLGISDELPSCGDIERIRAVGELVERYNSSL